MSNKSKFLKSRLARILVALAAVVITIAALELLAKIYTSETDAVKELSPIELAKNISQNIGSVAVILEWLPGKPVLQRDY